MTSWLWARTSEQTNGLIRRRISTRACFVLRCPGLRWSYLAGVSELRIIWLHVLSHNIIATYFSFFCSVCSLPRVELTFTVIFKMLNLSIEHTRVGSLLGTIASILSILLMVSSLWQKILNESDVIWIYFSTEEKLSRFYVSFVCL